MSFDWKKLAQLILLISATLVASDAFATTFYIAANGSDGNSGTSKSSPWLHAPGMAGVSGIPASYSPRPGDSFIFRGCDSWHNTGNPGGLPWTITWSGTSGSPIYFGGFDTTWSNGSCANSGVVDTVGTTVYLLRDGESTVGTSSTPFVWRNGDGSASSWVGGSITINGTAYTIASVQSPWQLTLTTGAGTQNSATYSSTLWGRPILNMDGALFSTGDGSIVTGNSLTYVNFDMWDIKGMYWNDTSQGASFVDFVAQENNNPEYVILTNLYVHGWSHATFTASSSPQSPFMIWQGSTANVAPGQEDGWIDIDGGDSLDAQFYGGSGLTNCSTDPTHFPEGRCATGSGLGFEGYNVHDSRFRYLSNGIVSNNTHLFENNLFERIYNCISNGGYEHGNAWEFNGEYAGNTLIYNNLTRYNTTGVTGWINPNATDYVFNNVWYGNLQQDLDQCAPGTCASGPSGGQAVYDNNTWVIGSVVGNAGYSTFVNNLWITPGGTSGANSGTSETNSVALTPSAATTDGYLASNLYMPTSGTAPTIGAGANLTGTCTSAVNALCVDTTAGDTTTPVVRPNSAWNIGAYQTVVGAGSVTTPQPPTALSATVQ